MNEYEVVGWGVLFVLMSLQNYTIENHGSKQCIELQTAELVLECIDVVT